jgi:hypothetical protein
MVPLERYLYVGTLTLSVLLPRFCYVSSSLFVLFYLLLLSYFSSFLLCISFMYFLSVFKFLISTPFFSMSFIIGRISVMV